MIAGNASTEIHQRSITQVRQVTLIQILLGLLVGKYLSEVVYATGELPVVTDRSHGHILRRIGEGLT